MNEILLISSVIFIYGMALVGYKFFGKTGLYCLSAVATILANVEVILLINAFGMEQTLGNVGIFSSIFFLILSQSWLLYTPSVNDTMMDSVKSVFGNTPRMIISSLLVYTISQFFDVWLYHKWWGFTEKKFGNKRKFLWLRNNGSTLISQILNTALFTFLAFVGTYDLPTMISIFFSSYIIYVFTSLLDTPFVYLARRIKDSEVKKSNNVAE